MQIARKEILLTIGLVLAVALAFTGQMTGVLDGAGGPLSGSHFGALPGLALMAALLLVYIQSTRRELEAQAAATADQARRAHDRADELERLVAFSQALTQSLDIDAIRAVVVRYLPEIAGTSGGWVVTSAGGHSTCLLGPATVQTARGPMSTTDLALEALGQSGEAAQQDGFDYEGQVCFPMIAAGASLGLIGVPATTPSLSEARRPVLAAAAALLGVSLRSAHLLRDIRENSLRDALTGCVNRAHALEVAASDLKRARRSHLPLSLIMFDLDHFKSINDRFGHLCGDTVLAAVGARIRATLRASDLKCRYGGEEFLALLPDTSFEGAQHVAESLRRDISALEIPWHGQIIRVTSSFGVAIARKNELDPIPLIARADEALYRAKRDGRNCVRVTENPLAPTAGSR